MKRKRRMALYDIEESEVILAIEEGEKQVLPDGKLFFIFKIND